MKPKTEKDVYSDQVFQRKESMQKRAPEDSKLKQAMRAVLKRKQKAVK